MAKVLVTDDEKAICDAFSQFLMHDGHHAIIASSGEQAIDIVKSQRPDAVFLDIQMPGMNGLETLKQINIIDPAIPVIMMTAYGNMQTAISAMHEGAFDYLGKPVELTQIRNVLNKALYRPTAASSQTSSPLQQSEQQGRELIGQTPVMQELFKYMGLLTTNDLTVLIMGESGVGKELVARGIHQNSLRKEHPFIPINCAAIPETLIESELFGHEKGAFTGAHERRIGRFEAASHGTLFLDEISELPLHLQSKLLRVLQDRSIERIGSVRPVPTNARVIAATNRDLAAEVKDGRFREDLYHRLKLATLEIPPLRERKDDIEVLVQHFLMSANEEIGKSVEKVEDAVLAKLRAYHWPGNVRELENTIRRSMLTVRGKIFTIHDLSMEGSIEDPNISPDPLCELKQTLRSVFYAQLDNAGKEHEAYSMYDEIIRFVEQEIINLALDASGNNQVAASKLLRLHRSTLRKKMRDPD